MTFRNGTHPSKARFLGSVAVIAGLLAGLSAWPALDALNQEAAVLLKSHFADLSETWTVWDDPAATNGPSRWKACLTELSGIKRPDGKIATALLAGDAGWADYAVETTLAMARSPNSLVGIVVGYQGPERYYVAGYNFETKQYEIEARTPAGFELLGAVKRAFPQDQDVRIRTAFADSRIELTAGDETVLDVGIGQAARGRFGLGLSRSVGARVHFGPVKVISLSGGTPGNLLFEEDFSTPGLSRWQVWDDPAASGAKSRWSYVLSEYSGISHRLPAPATLIIAGEAGWSDYAVQTRLYPFQASGALTGIVFGYQSPEQYCIAGYNFQRSRFELGESTPRGYSLLAYAEMPVPRQDWLPLRVEFRDGRMIFQFAGTNVFDLAEGLARKGKVGLGTSGLKNGDLAIGGFEVVSLRGSALPKEEIQDLLAGRRGAAVIYRPSVPKGDRFHEIIDHPLGQTKNLANTFTRDLAAVELPEEAVFCFPQGRFVEIRKIAFALLRDTAPKEVRLWTSLQSPKGEFVPLATLELENKSAPAQEFDVPATKAKYLKVQIVSGHGDKKIDIPEMFVWGRFLERPRSDAAPEDLGPVDLREKEKNDTAALAQPVPLETYVGGEASGGDTDFYRISLKGRPAGTLTLSVNGKGIIRPHAALKDGSGQVLPPARDATVGNVRQLAYEIGPGDYFFEIKRPDSYLTIVYDDSGSMRSSVETVKSVLKGYLDNLGMGLYLQLMKYADEPVTLSDFTKDPSALREAIDKRTGEGGGTATLPGLEAAVLSVSQKPGSRGVLAIFDEIVTSGPDYLKQYIRLWDLILDGGVSFSTIGVREDWDRETPLFKNTTERIFREIAYASQGGFFLAPTPDKVKESADRIFQQLTSPLEYRFVAAWSEIERSSGSLAVKLEEGAEPEAAKSVEIIMDASNSMWGQIGGVAKIAIAREVLTRTIGELPDTMNVGLRVYGHRFALNDAKACADTELLVPIGPVDKTKLIDTVNAIQLKGKTPLVHSVLEAVKDFENIPNGSIVLVTDGIESCGGDIASIAPAIKAAGLELRVHIVGFDIKEKEARAELESIAASTGGRYIDARNADELRGALGQTLKLEYAVLDARGAEVARGVVSGPAVELESGSYTVRVMVEPAPVEASVVVNPGSGLTLTLRRAQGRWVLD